MGHHIQRSSRQSHRKLFLCHHTPVPWSAVQGIEEDNTYQENHQAENHQEAFQQGSSQAGGIGQQGAEELESEDSVVHDEILQDDFSWLMDHGWSSDEQTMPLPPETSYPSIAAAVDSINEWAEPYGWWVWRGRSKGHKRWLMCGHSKSTNKNKGRRGSIQRTSWSVKQSCPFELWLLADDKSDLSHTSWQLVWPDDQHKLVHIHQFAPETEALPAYHRRRLRKKLNLQSLVLESMRAGITNTQVLSLLNQRHPGHGQQLQDITNVRQRIWSAMTADFTITDAAVRLLQDKDFFYKLDTQTPSAQQGISSQFNLSENHSTPQQLTRLFIAHPLAEALLLQFYDVIFLDCTYSTNQYNMPLLSIVGITGTNNSFNVGLCFMPGETTPDFVWALAQLKELLHKHRVRPRLFVVDRDRACLAAVKATFPGTTIRLCSWHMYKGVKAWLQLRYRATLDLETGEKQEHPKVSEFLEKFRQAVEATTEQQFDLLCQSIDSLDPDFFHYLQREWFHYDFLSHLAAHKLSFLRTFGITSTSRVEGNHSSLKTWIKKSNKNILAIITVLLGWWTTTFQSIQAKLHTERTKTYNFMLNDADKVLYSNVAKHVYKHALILVRQQDSLALEEQQRMLHQLNTQQALCQGRWTCQHGLPCRHSLLQHRLQNTALPLDSFDQHWLIRPVQQLRQSSPPSAPLLQPQRMPSSFRATARSTAGRARAGRLPGGVSGTQRSSLWSEEVAGMTTGQSRQRQTQRRSRGGLQNQTHVTPHISSQQGANTQQPLAVQDSDNDSFRSLTPDLLVPVDNTRRTAGGEPHLPSARRAPMRCSRCFGIGHSRVSRLCPQHPDTVQIDLT